MIFYIIRLIDKPEMRDEIANWFHNKWSVPLEAYLESMNDCLTRNNPIPQRYVTMENTRIIEGKRN